MELNKELLNNNINILIKKRKMELIILDSLKTYYNTEQYKNIDKYELVEYINNNLIFNNFNGDNETILEIINRLLIMKDPVKHINRTISDN